MRTITPLRNIPHVTLLSCLFLAACSQPQAHPTRVYRMGDRVQVGPLIYNILDTEWKTELGEGTDARTPKHRFLLIQLSVTNSGARETAIPPVTLEDPRGVTWSEVTTSGEGVTNWLGILRKLAPAQTEQGRVVFDVPTGAFRLRVTDDSAEPGKEIAALVEIPLRLEPEPLPQVLKELTEPSPGQKR